MNKKKLKANIAVCMCAVVMLIASSSVMAATMTKTVTLPTNGNEVTVCAASSFYKGNVQIQGLGVSSGTISKEHPVKFLLRASDGRAISDTAQISSVPTSTILTPRERVSWRLVGFYSNSSGTPVKITLGVSY